MHDQFLSFLLLVYYYYVIVDIPNLYFMFLCILYTGIDFTVLNSPIELTLRPGTTEACTDDIQIIDDEIYEGKEIITLELMPIFPIPVGISTAVVTINDDDSQSYAKKIIEISYICTKPKSVV